MTIEMESTPRLKDDVVTQPCGCWRGVTRRSVPKLTPGRIEDGGGQPVLDAGGGITVEEVEEIEDGLCPTHAAQAAEIAADAGRALAEGVPSSVVIAALAGGSKPTDAIAMLRSGMPEEEVAAVMRGDRQLEGWRGPSGEA